MQGKNSEDFQLIQFSLELVKKKFFFKLSRYLEIALNFYHNGRIDWEAICKYFINCMELECFQDGDLYHIETSPLGFRANYWAGFYMIVTSLGSKWNYILQ